MRDSETAPVDAPQRSTAVDMFTNNATTPKPSDVIAAMIGNAERAMCAEGIAEDVRRRVINTMVYGHPDPNSVMTPFVCPRCGKPTWHPKDAEQRYCGGTLGCAWWTGDAHLSLPDGRPRSADQPAEGELL